MDKIPRRIRIDQSQPAELAIRNAVNEVEKMPADVRLTKAVNLLDQARELVADFIDGIPDHQSEERLREKLRLQLERELKDTNDPARKYYDHPF